MAELENRPQKNEEYEGKWSAFKDGKIILYLKSEKMRIWSKCPITGQMVDEDSCKHCGLKGKCGG